MEIKIGRYTQIGNAQFYLKAGENAWLEFVIGSATIRINVRMKEVGPDLQYKIFGENDYGVIELVDFRKPRSGGSPDYIYLGRHGDEEAFFTFYGTSIGTTNYLQLQFYIER